MNILTIDVYKDFKCIAEACSFSCCEGWRIKVDNETINKWKANEQLFNYVSNNLKYKKSSNKTEYDIKMGNQKQCPFLDKKKLCNIVKDYGEDNLPKICREFPRQENELGGVKEHSLNCSCPVVVDILNSKKDKLSFIYQGDNSDISSRPVTVQIRNTILAIMNRSQYSLNDRILIIFSMLLAIEGEESSIQDIINNFEKEDYLNLVIDLWKNTKVNIEDSFVEINELFLDIVENYKEEKKYSSYLKYLHKVAEEIEYSATNYEHWNNFQELLKPYEILLENTLILKIFSSCVNDDINELIMFFQLIITEYVMVRYSSFLKWMVNKTKDIDYIDIRDFIVIYSRIVGNNSEGMVEFWEESFEDTIWDLGYLVLLINDSL